MRNRTWVWLGVMGVLATGCSSARKAPPLYGGTTTLPTAANESGSAVVLPFVVRDVSDDETYGYSEKNPIRVGGGRSAGVRNQLRYLNALKGPQGQAVTYERKASCCPFRTRRGVVDNSALLDVYAVTWTGNPTPVTLYLNMYRGGKLLAPRGFTGAQ
ncbi:MULTISPECIES: hypothetical protein [Hymenobacter]|uniref:2-dehydro-3-deoxyphosphooctonate aldolase n=1 Tax=Hymenobacter armeniacus TaxID=2771358 RepID=A0ABR8JMJ3_9BACT|nr:MULTISPECIES: hypothetical protein [Hymenobacter]MBD2721221.1 hypothetical protein [Hymenobacter armeniacus]MBJ6109172.1 hypothetical protein [Hymenobacter sp. BT523]